MTKKWFWEYTWVNGSVSATCESGYSFNTKSDAERAFGAAIAQFINHSVDKKIITSARIYQDYIKED